MITKVTYRRKVGLGDMVEMAVRPIAATSDKLLGTRLKDCLGCTQRKEALNAAVPNVNPLAK